MTTNDKNGQQTEARNTPPSDRPADLEGSALSDAELEQVAGGRKRNEDPDAGGEVFRIR